MWPGRHFRSNPSGATSPVIPIHTPRQWGHISGCDFTPVGPHFWLGAFSQFLVVISVPRASSSGATFPAGVWPHRKARLREDIRRRFSSGSVAQRACGYVPTLADPGGHRLGLSDISGQTPANAQSRITAADSSFLKPQWGHTSSWRVDTIPISATASPSSGATFPAGV